MYNKRLQKYLDNIVSQAVDYDTVVTGILPLILHGVSTASWNNATLYVTSQRLHGINAYGLIAYHYLQEIDTVNYVESTPLTTHVLLPTIERALVELIRDKFVNIVEGDFLEALCDYMCQTCYDYSKLIEVANHFGVSKDEIDHWIEEARYY